MMVRGEAPGKIPPWNKCDACGRFIPYRDFETGKALRKLITPDSDVSKEDWVTLCEDHYLKEQEET